MKLIIKKEICVNWLSYKTFIDVPNIFYRIVKKYYELRGYEVEVLNERKKTNKRLKRKK